MVDGDSGLDPRYAAQFQRGYAGPPRPRPSRTTSASTRSPSARPPGGSLPAAASEPTPAEGDEQEPVDADEPRARTVAWAEWSLFAAGVLLVAAAALILWQSATDTRAFTGGYELSERVFVSVRDMLPGPLFVAGVVALAVGVVVRAVRPR